jgi:hypothetical protein
VGAWRFSGLDDGHSGNPAQLSEKMSHPIPARHQPTVRRAEQRQAIHTGPVAVPAATLEGCAGTYQERNVTRRGSELYYTDGAGRESRLTPLGATLFEVEKDPASRLRFVADGPGPAVKVVGLFRDGSADESARTASR